MKSFDTNSAIFDRNRKKIISGDKDEDSDNDNAEKDDDDNNEDVDQYEVVAMWEVQTLPKHRRIMKQIYREIQKKNWKKKLL